MHTYTYTVEYYSANNASLRKCLEKKRQKE